MFDPSMLMNILGGMNKGSPADGGGGPNMANMLDMLSGMSGGGKNNMSGILNMLPHIMQSTQQNHSNQNTHAQNPQFNRRIDNNDIAAHSSHGTGHNNSKNQQKNTASGDSDLQYIKPFTYRPIKDKRRHDN
jgi:hypothetical protein